MDFENIKKKIKEKSGLNDEEINKKILEKQRELSNLVSKEGAAYIIAKELGLKIFPKTKRRLEIKNIVPKLRNLNLNVRVVKVFETKEFKRKDKIGRVANVILGDSTGTIRMSLWDDQTKITEKLKSGMAVKIFGGYTREDGRGNVEVRLGKKGGLKLLEESSLPPLEKITKKGPTRKKIANLKEGSVGEVKAGVVQMFETSVFYETCPVCRKRVRTNNGKFECDEHGEVKPEKMIVLSGVIDDGTGNIRTVFFRDNALKLIGMDINEALKIRDSFFESINVLGKEFIMFGRVRRNKLFNRLEFVVNNVRDIEIENEINKLINNLTTNVLR